MMPLMVGVLLAVAVGLMATSVGLDRDRALYPTVTIVIAFLYSLFAVLGESTQALALELVVGSVFLMLAIWGFRASLWIVAITLAAHGLLDLVHPRIITNPGVPAWWPAFCGAYDVAAAVYLASMLKIGRIRAVAVAR
jgi:hypothetical protein